MRQADRTPEQRKADYEATYAAQRRLRANPEAMARLRQALADLDARTADR